MKDVIVLFGICVVALTLGTVLYFNGVGGSSDIPDIAPSQQQVVSERPQVPAVTGPVVFSVIGQGVRAAGETERKNYAVRDQNAFAELWAKAHGNDGAVMPTINFDEYQVIGVFAGVRPSGGYAISVVRVVDTLTERLVTIAITAPGANCATTQALTNPYQMVRLPASDLPLKREYVEEIRPCP